MNCVIFAVLLSAIGGCYVWLGVKKNERAAQIRTTYREIEDLKKQIKAVDLHFGKKLDSGPLGERVTHNSIPLKPIPIGRGGKLVRLPEPMLRSETAAALPADQSLAATLHP